MRDRPSRGTFHETRLRADRVLSALLTRVSV